MDQKELTVLRNFINGEFCPPDNGEYLDNVAPATNQVIAKVPRSTQTDVDRAVEAARQALPAWSARPIAERAEFLEKIAKAIENRFDEFVLAESTDCGKALSTARNVDIPRTLSNLRFFAGAILHDETGCHQMVDAVNYSHRTAVGVAALITPWNLPLYLLSWKVAPALACGNTIVAKPSELTPMTASLLSEVIAEVGLPAGVFNLVHGLGAEAGSAMVGHEGVDLVSFTGGTATGQKVGALASSTFKKLSLELGGKNATIVFEDADMEKTIQGVVASSFLNAGQICLCGSRLFVQQSIYDRFVTALVEATKRLSVGNPNTSFMGSLISQAHRSKIESYVEIARQEGGEILCGGDRPQLEAPYDAGAFYLPTIIAGLSPESRCSREEIFGPVLVVHPFETEADVIRLANNTRYGLAGSVWTQNLSRGHRVAQSIRTGMIWVNCWLKRDLRVPFGGVKESGVGREGGRHSIEFFSELKNICIQY
eukprot:TRINITY_DN3869_c0_g1_i12.p1 TRINITY_DN3869_c0_g1~~TRINITY_DN3869_c0_g1_i12.p1  ORF type:complete len:483 (+),score=155.01 TRINITY_DN3869_c0_g1_i12:64-1512(+)